MKKAEQGEGRNAREARNDVDAVRSDALRGILQIPSDKLSKRNKSDGDHSEQRHDKRRSEKHACPTGGQGRHAPHVDFDAGAKKLRQGGDTAAQGRYRGLQNQREQQQRSDQSDQLHAPAAQITAKTESQETGDQYEVLEVGKNPDVGRDPPDHHHLDKQAEQADQNERGIPESAEFLRRDLQCTMDRRRRLQPIEDPVDKIDRDRDRDEQRCHRTEGGVTGFHPLCLTVVP